MDDPDIARCDSVQGTRALSCFRCMSVQYPSDRNYRQWKMKIITPLIICGGAGTRLWPASRQSAPKQFIPLLGDSSTFQDTLKRVSDPALFAKPIVVTSSEYQFMVRDQLSAIGVEADLILEPMRRDSGPAIAAGAIFLAERDPQALMLVLAADHVVQDEKAFRAAITTASVAAQHDAIVTFGVKPSHPATGYGYLQPGDATQHPGIYRLEAFVEKPDATRAAEFVGSGYLWNSGNFLFRIDSLLEDYDRLEPQTMAAVRDAVASSRRDNGALHLELTAFQKASPMAIDYAVMEKTAKACVVPVDMGWSDVGSWHAVWELSDKDEAGNAMHVEGRGDARFVNASNNYVRAEHLVCLVGVSNLAVVQTRDATLVFDRTNPDSVRQLVSLLQEQGREEITNHLEVFRPWGSYQRLDLGKRFQVKRIVVKPGGQLSLQRHFHRAEHWVIVRGTARVTIDDAQVLLHENQSTFIPLGAVHRLENPGKIPLELVEVQSGSYLGEDDIVRLEDIYDRG